MSSKVIEFVKYWSKYFLGNVFSGYKEGLCRPIFIFSTRRSGSTLLMRMIYSQPGVGFIAQPLNLWSYHPYGKHLSGLHSLSRFIALDSDGEGLLFEFFEGILQGRIWVRGQWNPLDPDFSSQVERLVVKVLSAKDLMDWFVANFDIEVIYLVRHPIPVALSILKRSWGCTAEAFLSNQGFCERLLDERQVNRAWDILRNGSPLERYVLEWCLENAYPLSVCKQRPWLTLTYEELVLRPEKISGLICERLALPSPKRMAERVSLPSKTTLKDSKRDIKHRGPGYLATRWADRLGTDEKEKMAEIINVFCPTRIYELNSPYPHSSFCHFGSLGKGSNP